jgi:hypothetical protein
MPALVAVSLCFLREERVPHLNYGDSALNSKNYGDYRLRDASSSATVTVIRSGHFEAHGGCRRSQTLQEGVRIQGYPCFALAVGSTTYGPALLSHIRSLH